MKKKALCMFAGVLLLLILCAACGTDSAEMDAQEDTAETAQQETQQLPEQTTQEASEEPEYPEWSEQTYGSYAEAYADLLDQWRRESYNKTARFYLIYLDGDDVPELIIPEGSWHIAESTLIAFHDQKWVKLAWVGSCGCVTYVPKTGLVFGSWDGMGVHAAECYQLSRAELKHLTQFFYGEWSQESGDYLITIKIDDVPFSKEEFCTKWDEMMAGRELYDTHWEDAFELTDENIEALKTNPEAFLLTGMPSELKVLPDWSEILQ